MAKFNAKYLIVQGVTTGKAGLHRVMVIEAIDRSGRVLSYVIDHDNAKKFVPWAQKTLEELDSFKWN